MKTNRSTILGLRLVLLVVSLLLGRVFYYQTNLPEVPYPLDESDFFSEDIILRCWYTDNNVIAATTLFQLFYSINSIDQEIRQGISFSNEIVAMKSRRGLSVDCKVGEGHDFFISLPKGKSL